MTLRRLCLCAMAWVAACVCQSSARAGDTTPSRAAAAPQRQVVRMQLAGQEGAARTLGCTSCQILDPSDAPAEKLLAEPKYKSNRPVYYAARLGDGKDTVYTMVLDESQGSGKGYDTVYVDADNDNRIDAQHERFAIRVGSQAAAEPIRIRLQVAAGGAAAPYFVSLAAFEHCDPKFPVGGVRIELRDASYHVGEAVFGGQRRKIAVADLNANGLFNDMEPRPFAGDRIFVARDAEGRSFQSFPYGGFTRIGGQWYTIVAAPDGRRLEITSARPPLGRIEAAPQVVGARLNSPTQPLDLDLQEGAEEAVAGTYRLHSVQLMSDTGWGMPGSFPDGEPEVTVRAGQTVRLAAGLPLTVEPQVVADDDRTLRISLLITGTGGESYRWSQRPGTNSRAGFDIFNASGKRIASGGFQYG